MMQFSIGDRPYPTSCGLRFPLAVLAVLLGATTLAGAQSVRVSASTDSLTIGDRFHLHIAADYPDGMTPVLPDFSRGDTTLGDLTIVKQVGFPQRSTNASGRTDSVTYEVTTFALDTARVPPITVAFSQETDTVQSASEPFSVAVGSLVPEDTEGIKGLAPLASFPRPLWPWILGGGLALILAAALLYLMLRRRDESEEKTVEAMPDIPPYAEAMTRLQELETMDLEEMNSPKPFFVELSDLLRTYIERTTEIHARELTSRELIHLLKRRDGQLDKIYTPPQIERIRVILRLADLVKFADQRPVPEDSRSALEATRKTVDALHRSTEEISKVRERAEAETSVEN